MTSLIYIHTHINTHAHICTSSANMYIGNIDESQENIYTTFTNSFPPMIDQLHFIIIRLLCIKHFRNARFSIGLGTDIPLGIA